MGSVNKALLIGHLGADPELKYTPSNRPVCNLSVATNEVWKDKNGQKQERVEWHRVNVWGEQAENCQKYLAKGRSVYVEGKLQTRSWEDTDGKKRYATEIVAERVVFLGGASGEGGTSAGAKKRGWGSDGGGGSGKHREETYVPPADDDIPF